MLQDHNDDEELNKREPLFSFSSSLLALDFLIAIHHFLLAFRFRGLPEIGGARSLPMRCRRVPAPSTTRVIHGHHIPGFYATSTLAQLATRSLRPTSQPTVSDPLER